MSKKYHSLQISSNDDSRKYSVSFSNVAKEYSALITKLALSFSMSSDKNDDLFQEGLIALYRAFITYDGKSASFSTYASLCIKRSMISWLKKNRATNLLSLDDFQENGDVVLSNDNPELEVISKDFCSRFYESAKKLLSDYEYHVFELTLQDFRTGEIAKVLSCSPKSVENALYRIKSKLRTSNS